MENYVELIGDIIKRQIELGNDRFVVYPAGEMGRLVKNVLNQNFGIKELALVDNHVSDERLGIISFDELCEKEDWYVVLFSVINTEVRDQLIAGLRGIKRPIVDVYCECDRFKGEIFDFCNPKMRIDEVNEEQINNLFERTSQQWNRLGDTEPYWSVLTHGKYLSENINEQYIQEFYRSGEKRCDKLVKTLIRNGIIKSEIEANQLDITEIGCGCGRVTSALGERFKHVHAYDISSGNMNIAREYIKKDNVDFHLIKSVEDYSDLPETDVFYTVLVLQHNVPPVIQFLLSKMMHSLRPDGVGFFQVPSYLKGYSFIYDDWISNKSSLDMHVLPQNEIFKTIKQAGCDVLECYMDYDTGTNSGYISSTYVVKKN